MDSFEDLLKKFLEAMKSGAAARKDVSPWLHMSGDSERGGKEKNR